MKGGAARVQNSSNPYANTHTTNHYTACIAANLSVGSSGHEACSYSK